jgi:hypothetical protein
MSDAITKKIVSTKKQGLFGGEDTTATIKPERGPTTEAQTESGSSDSIAPAFASHNQARQREVTMQHGLHECKTKLAILIETEARVHQVLPALRAALL